MLFKYLVLQTNDSSTCFVLSTCVGALVPLQNLMQMYNIVQKRCINVFAILSACKSPSLRHEYYSIVAHDLTDSAFSWTKNLTEHIRCAFLINPKLKNLHLSQLRTSNTG